MVLFAFLGGIILNLMPCVFPVLGVKIMGFVNQAGEDKAKIRRHGLVFAAGVLVSLWALVAALLVLKHTGEKVGWGFQLQNPIFLALMILVLFAFALNLCGLFEIRNLTHRRGLWAAAETWLLRFLLLGDLGRPRRDAVHRTLHWNRPSGSRLPVAMSRRSRFLPPSGWGSRFLTSSYPTSPT